MNIWHCAFTRHELYNGHTNVINSARTLPIYSPWYLSFSLYLLQTVQMGHVERFSPQQEMACLAPAFGPIRLITHQINLSTNKL